MAKQFYLPKSDSGKQTWLQNFSNKLAGYKTKYNITDGEVTDMQNSFAVFNYWFNYLNQYNEYLKKLTNYKNELRDGFDAGGGAPVEPAPPSLGAAPAPVEPGIFRRVVSIANSIKSKTNYTLADGQDLGVEGAENTTALPDKPVIAVRLSDGGHPEIVWKRAGMDAIDIYVKRSSGSDWQFLATDTVPNYTDTFQLPASGKSAVWKYKCIYRNDDAQAGNWSDDVSVTVAGM